MVDPPRSPTQRAGPAGAIQTSRPVEMPERVVAFRPFCLKQRLCFSIALLLFPVRLQGVPAMVPDHGARVEADAPASVLDAPAEVDIVSGGTKARVEAADFEETLPSHRQIAPGHMLGEFVGQQDMHRA